MEVTNKGYLFDCRDDVLGGIGVMENYHVTENSGKLTVEFLCSVDKTGAVLKPAQNDLSGGFVVIDVDDLQRFVRSNKPCFSKFGDFAMLASAKLVFDKSTGELLNDDSKVTFYVAKAVSHRLKSEPVLVCDRVSVKDGLNVFKISEIMLSSYMENFISSFTMQGILNRETYLRSRLGA